jgi:hypothetical protein
MSKLLTTSVQSWGIYAPKEVPLRDKGARSLVPMRGIYKGRLPLFVAKELFAGRGEPWFRRGRLK